MTPRSLVWIAQATGGRLVGADRVVDFNRAARTFFPKLSNAAIGLECSEIDEDGEFGGRQVMVGDDRLRQLRIGHDDEVVRQHADAGRAPAEATGVTSGIQKIHCTDRPLSGVA